MINKKSYKRSCIGIIFILCILISSSFVLAYTQSYYSSQNNNAMGIGIFSGAQSLRVDDSMCQQGNDFLIQIGPLSCTPSPVRSDLLAEENVNVFCQMTATQINPFVDVKRIDTISFQREYPKEVVGIGYQPAQSALGYYTQISESEYSNMEGSLLLQNLGYVVITLKRQPNESALTNCKKDAFGTDICWVEGNLTANLRYDIQNVFGVGSSVFYLPVMDDSEWEKNYIASSFWEGRGYLRASSVGENDAVLSVYSDNSVASSLLSTGRKYTLARYSSNIALKTGETSNKIFLPGLSPCLASLQLKLEGVVNPDTRAMIKVNEDYTEVANGETFLDGKCTASNLERKGVTSSVKITCSGADNAIERKPFYLSISPRVNLSIGGVKKDYGVGDLLYKLSDTQNNVYKERYVYLGYVGTVGQATDVNSLYVTLVAIPSDAKDGDKNKLSDSEISSVASWSETAMASPDTGLTSVDFISKAFNKFVGTAMTIGKSVIDGQDFINIPYIGSGSDPIKFRGTAVSLMGFFSGADDGIFPSDNLNYTNAMSDFSTVVNSYPNEVEKANSIQSLGEQALYQKIYLTNALGMKKTVIELCSEFEKSYPDTYLNVGICSNVVKLSSSSVAGQQVTINGVTKIISFDGIKEPSKNDYSAELLVQGPNGKIVPYVLEKNKMVQLTGLRTTEDQKSLTTLEYMQLSDLSTDSATVRINVAGKSALQGLYLSDYKLLKKGESQSWGGPYTFTLKDINLNKVAKVSVISNQDFARSNSTFNFKIGIEKRLIQLSPEKAQEKIVSLNKSMGEWQKASDALYTTVKTMKAACAATGFILTAKNFLANSGGKAIARQTVMGKSGDGGWNDKCAKLVPKTYKTLDACFLHFSDQIEKEVDNTYKIIQTQNNEIANLKNENSGSSDNAGFVSGYSKKVVTSLSSANVNQVLDSLTAEQKKNLDIDKIKGMFNSDNSFQTYYEKNTYTLDQLKEIELYSTYINQYGSNPNDQTVVNAKKNLVSVLSDVYVNSKATIEEATFAQTTGMVGNSLIGSFNKLIKMQDIQVESSNRILFKNIQYKDIDATGSAEGVKISDTDYAYAIEDTSSSPAKDYIVRYNADGVVAQTYEIISETSFAKASLKVYIGNDGKNNANPFSLKFDKVDASSYKNQFKSSYGSSTPLIRYFETAPYKGKPAIVPFDLKNGWYAGISSPQTSYDASGRVVSFYLCNVMANGIEQFQLDNFGGDTCQLINLGVSQTYSAFNGIMTEGEVRDLVTKAKNAIEAAQTARARQEGLTYVSINGNKIKVGEPPTQSSASQCTDFMSASDCNILFNVCDPVICPTSRCNLGGNYPVTNVIQTGIIGSIALCYPNAKWNGGDVYIPVCLSGIQAGLDNWISVEKDYRDCLQTSIDTGETVGICDEINSIYTCEFFWKQAVPIIKIAAPKLLGKVTGQSGKGGGEYNGITSALDSVKKSIDYWKQYYAANSYNAFKVRSTEQVGTELCGNFASIIYPSSGSFLDNLITPDSPVQFTGKFDEIPLTTTTNPPTSQYKVYYHIYAGKDTGVYYTVYLRGSGSSYYQDTVQNRNVKSSYIAKGDYASDTVDFTAPSGYQQLCIVVNGQEECGFKEVSTSFAVNYLSDLYLAQQASNTSIKTEEECISGTTSLYNILNLNAEAAANNLINPEIYAQGIIRICATKDPGVGTDVSAGIEGARWRKVGYCGQTSLGCWIDTDSVKNVIKTMNIENKALGDISGGALQYLNGEYLTADQFSAKMEEINAEPSNFNKVALITDIINKVYYSNQKAQLFYNRGKAYSELAKKEYDVLAAAKKAAEEAAAAAAAQAASIAVDQVEFIKASPDIPCVAGTDYGIMDGYFNGILLKIRVCVISGIDVNSQVSKNAQDLVTDAKNAGYDFSNSGGFRNLYEQATLYKDNCDISAHPECDFKTPANYPSPQTLIQNYYSTCRNLVVSSCKPETAVPGYSDHQMGLAIDFAIGGKQITANSDVFNWLSQNANKYGLVNYKPEPWHWYFTSGTGTISGGTTGTTSNEIFLIKETFKNNVIFGIGSTDTRDVYYKYEDSRWKWSMNSISNWQDVSTTVVSIGKDQGTKLAVNNYYVITTLNKLDSNAFERGKAIIQAAGGTLNDGSAIELNAAVNMDDYFSPSFQFEDGTGTKNNCYKYFDSAWHWQFTSAGYGTLIKKTCDNSATPNRNNWYAPTVFKDSSGQVPTDKSVEFIKSLQSKSYLEGLQLLIQRTKAKGEGGASNPDLVTEYTSMSDKGIFEVDFGSQTDAQFYRFDNALGWQWNFDNDEWWTSTKIYIPTSGPYSYSKREAPQDHKNLISAINGRDILLGAEILFDPTSKLLDLYNGGTGTTTCTDTCLSLGYKCGTQTICGKSTDCGNCATNQICNSAGQCVSSVATPNEIRQNILDSTAGLEGAIVPKAHNTDCSNAVSYIYEDASCGLSNCVYSAKSGQKYNIILSNGTTMTVTMGTQTKIVNENSAVIFQTATNCESLSDTLAYADVLKDISPGDRIDFVYDQDDGHGVIFINWVAGQEYKIARVFDWSGGNINEGILDSLGNACTQENFYSNTYRYCKSYRYTTYDLSIDKHPVYRLWNPVSV